MSFQFERLSKKIESINSYIENLQVIYNIRTYNFK